MTEVVAYRLIVILALALGALAALLIGKLSKKPVPLQEGISMICACVLILVSWLALCVSVDAGRQYEGVSAIVTGTNLSVTGETVLTVVTGLDQDELDVTCLPEQKGCQGAQLNDIVLLDGSRDFTGIKASFQVKYLVPGAPR